MNKMQKSHQLGSLFALCATAMLASNSASAVTTVLNSGTNDWNTGASWSTGNVPTAADLAIINNNNEATLSSVAVDVGTIRMVNNANSATLTLSSGASLNVSTLFQMGAGGSGTATANINGGTFSFANSSLGAATTTVLNVNGGAASTDNAAGVQVLANGTMNVISGSFTHSGTGSRTVTDGDGAVNVSGGSFNAVGAAAADILRIRNDLTISVGTVNLTGGQVVFDQGHDLNVVGNAATINMDRLNYGSFVGAINFDFDSDGISSIVSSAFTNLANASIFVDGTSYTGGAGSFTLFESASLSGLPTAAVADNFDGFTTAFSQSGENYILTLTAVPEPGMSALLGGIFALSWVMVRRRR